MHCRGQRAAVAYSCRYGLARAEGRGGIDRHRLDPAKAFAAAAGAVADGAKVPAPPVRAQPMARRVRRGGGGDGCLAPARPGIERRALGVRFPHRIGQVQSQQHLGQLIDHRFVSLHRLVLRRHEAGPVGSLRSAVEGRMPRQQGGQALLFVLEEQGQVLRGVVQHMGLAPERAGDHPLHRPGRPDRVQPRHPPPGR